MVPRSLTTANRPFRACAMVVLVDLLAIAAVPSAAIRKVRARGRAEAARIAASKGRFAPDVDA